MNKTIQEFLKRLGLDALKAKELEECKTKKGFDVNSVVCCYGLFKPEKRAKRVSIADIVGCDYNYGSPDNIIDNLSSFFDEQGDNYHTRSLSMLNIPLGEAMSAFEESNKKEPICLNEVDSGKYIVAQNGMHRFHVMKMHYLSELSKINPQDKVVIKRLREKYSFNAEVNEIDFVKTYSAYMISLLDDDLKLENDYDADWGLTGKSCLKSYSDSEKKVVLNEEQLTDFVIKKYKEFLQTKSKDEKDRLLEELEKTYSSHDSFKDFYDYKIRKVERGEMGEW